MFRPEFRLIFMQSARTGAGRFYPEVRSSSKLRWLKAICLLLAMPLTTSTPTARAETRSPSIPEFRLSAQAKDLRLQFDVKLDVCLQSALSRIDEEIATPLGIPREHRAFGIVDLKGPRVAMINADRMFYGASVPKIAIVLEYLRQHPEFVHQPDSRIMRELQLVIKRSDNALAAKYGRLADLVEIQKMLLSSQYHLYEKDHGGGLWCGKYYGSDLPRAGDPLNDLSHAATVRQCLRYYLMMEQGRLGSPALCGRLREVFAAPWLVFHDDNFVSGLKGMGLTLIRKNGLWEDWHLDTARVALADRSVLIAGIVHHPNGPKYLSGMARALMTTLLEEDKKDDRNTRRSLEDSRWRHGHHVSYVAPCSTNQGWTPIDSPSQNESMNQIRSVELTLSSDGQAQIDWPILKSRQKFNEVLLSWNIRAPSELSYAVDIAVGQRFDGSWSPWLNIDQIGNRKVYDSPPRQSEAGRINVDYFASDRRFDQLRARVRLLGPASGACKLTVSRLVATISDTTGMPDSWYPAKVKTHSPEASKYVRRIAVPFRGQRTEHPDIAGRICSPTSLSMVMEYYGFFESTLKVAEACYDSSTDIYGNWPRNISGAYALGVPGYLTRFDNWTAVQNHIADNRPVIASIRFDKEGLIRAAPYKRTDGHLIVICGFDEDGNVHVNDPAAKGPDDGSLVYARDELEEAWFGGSGGVAYVLLPRDRNESKKP